MIFEPELYLGDGALRFVLPEGIDRRNLLDALRARPGVTDVVLTETRACVYFDPADPPEGPWDIDIAPVSERTLEARTIHIPIRYDGEDLDEVAAHAKMSREEVIHLHASGSYEVTMIGFLPGFAYLRGIDPRLVLPRRHTPRPRVAPRVLGIAAGYSGVFPFASPNGWNLIGTAVDFVAFTADRGARLQIGDRVRFEPVR